MGFWASPETHVGPLKNTAAPPNWDPAMVEEPSAGLGLMLKVLVFMVANPVMTLIEMMLNRFTSFILLYASVTFLMLLFWF